MAPFDDAGLTGPELEAVTAALARDPWLGPELSILDRVLAERPRRRFWVAFAELAANEPRPARAVLRALEIAAAGGGRRRRDRG